MDIFLIFFHMKVCCVFSLESPHRGDSNKYTQYSIFNIKKKITLNYPISTAVRFFFQESQEQVRNSRVRATEGVLYNSALQIS